MVCIFSLKYEHCHQLRLTVQGWGLGWDVGRELQGAWRYFFLKETTGRMKNPKAA